MKHGKKIAAIALAGIMMCGSAVPAFAADVEITEGKVESATTNVTLVKENPAPVFTIGIPNSVNIDSADPAQMSFTMTEENLKKIPEGKKVSVSIADAGYEGQTGKFALYSVDANAEATYKVFSSKLSTRPSEAYQIGDLLASFYGTEKVTDGKASVGRVLKADNYDELAAGTYEGTMTFQINVRNQ